jgi:hypothetical protein
MKPKKINYTTRQIRKEFGLKNHSDFLELMGKIKLKSSNRRKNKQARISRARNRK